MIDEKDGPLKLYTCTLLIESVAPDFKYNKAYCKVLYAGNSVKDSQQLNYAKLIQNHGKLTRTNKKLANLAINRMFPFSELKEVEKNYLRFLNLIFKYFEEKLPIDSENFWHGIGNEADNKNYRFITPSGVNVYHRYMHHSFSNFEHRDFNCKGWNKKRIHFMTGNILDPQGYDCNGVFHEEDFGIPFV